MLPFDRKYKLIKLFLPKSNHVKSICKCFYRARRTCALTNLKFSFLFHSLGSSADNTFCWLHSHKTSLHHLTASRDMTAKQKRKYSANCTLAQRICRSPLYYSDDTACGLSHLNSQQFWIFQVLLKQRKKTSRKFRFYVSLFH